MKKVTLTDESISLLLPFMWSAILGLQGMDMSDEGWVLTAYQQVYHSPESIESLFLYYSSIAVGGLWNEAFGWMGTYGFRLLYSFVTALLVFNTYHILKDRVAKWVVPVAAFFQLLWLTYGSMEFHHNQFSALVLSFSLLFMMRRKWMLAGLLLGLDVFCRLPNVTLLSLMLLFPLMMCFGKTFAEAAKCASKYLGGVVVGCGATVSYMLAAGHFDTFVKAVSSLGDAAGVSDSTHNLGYMLGIYLTDWWHVAVQGVLLPVPLYGNVIWTYAFCTVVLVWSVIERRKDESWVMLASTALIVLYFQPLGSDFGICNMGIYSIWLAVPLAAGFLWDKFKTGIRYRWVGLAALALPFCCYSATSAYSTLSCCLQDYGGRWRMLYRVQSPFATTFTTERNAAAMDSLLVALTDYVKEDDYLLCYQNTPMVHYLTRTRPYLYNPWLFTYDSGNFEKCIRRAEQEIPVLPVVVRDKGGYPTWSDFNPDWNNDKAEDSYLHTNRKITLLNEFLARHNYKVIWENSVFQILIN